MTTTALPPSFTPQQLVSAAEAIHDEMRRQVHVLRLAGATWQQVGAHLGVSRQAAHSRWRGLDDLGVQITQRDGVGYVECPATGAVLSRDDLRLEGAPRIVALMHRLRTEAVPHAPGPLAELVPAQPAGAVIDQDGTVLDA